MDPLSITASAFTVLTILATATKALSAFITDADVVNETLNDLHADLGVLADLIDNINRLFSVPNFCVAIQNTQKEWHVDLIRCLDRALKNCERDILKLQQMLSEFRAVGLGNRIKQGILKGILQMRLDQAKGGITKIKQNFQDHKSSIQLAFQMITTCKQLEAAERDDSNAFDLKKKIDQLQEAIAAMTEHIGQRRTVPGSEEQTKLLDEMEEIQTTSAKIKRAATLQLERLTSIVETTAPNINAPNVPPRPPPRKTYLAGWIPNSDLGQAGVASEAVSPVASELKIPRRLPVTPQPRLPPCLPPPDTPYFNSPARSQSSLRSPQLNSPMSPLASPQSTSSPIVEMSSDPMASSQVSAETTLIKQEDTVMSFEDFENTLQNLLAKAASEGMGLDKRYSEDVVSRVSELLSKVGKGTWSDRPRTFIVLRLINEVKVMDSFVSEGFKDVDFPYTDSTLPRSIKSTTSRHDFVQKQRYVLNTKLADLVQGGRHHLLDKSADTYFVPVRTLGKGGFSIVDEVQVRTKLTLQNYARKRIPRTDTFAKDRKGLRFFENEVHNLKRLSHEHLVKFVGSYTDKKHVGIIMEPVADTDLRHYLAKTTGLKKERSTLCKMFGCLSSAVAYLHLNKCRHKDLKPHNILIKDEKVYVADFGLALDYTISNRETTMGRPEAFTELYVAPEVGYQRPRNTKADIWSLGCIFLEITTVLCGKTLSDRIEFFNSTAPADTGASIYWRNPQAIGGWLNILLNSSTFDDNVPLHWVQDMTTEDPEVRPSADQLVEWISEAYQNGKKYGGSCCMNEVTSDDTSWQGSESDDDVFETADNAGNTQNTTLSPASTLVAVPGYAKDASIESPLQSASPQVNVQSSRPAAKPLSVPRAERHLPKHSLSETIETVSSTTAADIEDFPKAQQEAMRRSFQSQRPEEGSIVEPHKSATLVAKNDGSHEHTSYMNMQAVHIPKKSSPDGGDDDTEEIMPIETTLEEVFLKDHKQFEDILAQLRGGGYESWKSKLIKTISSTTKDPKGFNLLLVAVNFANDSLARDVVELVVQEDPDLITQTNIFGNSAIHYAAARNRMGLVKYLTKFGARLDIVNARGQTPLHVAVRAQSTPVVEFLLRDSSLDSLNTQDDKGRTALHLACRDDTPVNIVTGLLGAGADSSLKEDTGLTPVQLSEKTFNIEVIEALHPNGLDGLQPPASLIFMAAEDYTEFSGSSLLLCVCEVCQLIKAVDLVSMSGPNPLTKCACLLHLQSFQTDFLGDALLLQSTFDKCNCQECTNARGLTSQVMQAVQRSGCTCSTCLLANAPNIYGDMPPLGRYGDPLGRYPPLDPFGAPPPFGPFGDRFGPLPRYPPAGPFGAPPPFLSPYDVPPPPGVLPYGGPLGGSLPPADQPLIEYPGHEYYDMLIKEELARLSYDPFPGSRYNAAIDTLSNAGFKGNNSYRMNPEKALTWVTANYSTLQQVDEIVKILLDNRAQVNTTDKSGCTCLHIAARNGDIRLAKLLIERGADLNFARKSAMAAKAYFTPVRYALYYRQDLLLHLLLRAGANINEQEVYGRATLLHEIVGQYSILADHLPLLLAHGANPNLLDEKGNNSLHVAASKGHLYAVEALLNSGADIHSVSKPGATALTLAIEAGHTAVVSILVAKGANVHVKCSNGSPCALFLAVQKGHGAIVTLLLESPAVEDIKRTDRMRRTVLHVLADSTIEGILDTMGPLIDAGADINAEDCTGSTPLHEAARVGSTILASELVMRGATVHAQDRQGKTPLDIAIQKKHREVVELLGGKLKKKAFWRR